jgi:hypothetical protein
LAAHPGRFASAHIAFRFFGLYWLSLGLFFGLLQGQQKHRIGAKKRAQSHDNAFCPHFY